MSETIVGVMWCRNEADLLPHTIPAALEKVDCLMIADDDSDDGSWDVIQSFSKRLEYTVRRAEKMSSTPYNGRMFAKQHLLDEVRRRFGTKDVWVQIVESDVSILDTDVREAIRRQSVDDVSVRWHMLNACRRVWTPEYDLPRIPSGVPLHEYYDACHWMEQISSYTFRPLPEIAYTDRGVPWPQGFSHYLTNTHPHKLQKRPDSPLLIHYGFRSPTFYSNKMAPRVEQGLSRIKNPAHDVSTPESVVRTIPLYNGLLNNSEATFSPISRKGWQNWIGRL